MNGHIHFFPSITYVSLNLLEPSLFLGCTSISVMAFNMSSAEDRNTPEYLNFFWSTYFHKESGSAAIAKKKKKWFCCTHTNWVCNAHTLSVVLLENSGAAVQAWHTPPVKCVHAWGGHTRSRWPLPEHSVQATASTFFLR